MNKLFTEDQLLKICEIIDWWYLDWKKRITDDSSPHRLGVAKEKLKEIFSTHSQLGKFYE